eukprot:478776-Amphidinium_carterae.1
MTLEKETRTCTKVRVKNTTLSKATVGHPSQWTILPAPGQPTRLSKWNSTHLDPAEMLAPDPVCLQTP